MKKVVSKKDIEKEVKDNQSELINEGYWEDLKYYTAKVTKRYKADGKFFGKAKVDAAAKAKIQAILNKTGNDVIKRLDDFIKQSNAEFPNNRKGDDFLATVLHIANIYESLVNATKIPQGQRGSLGVDAANEIIDDLREYTKKALDTDLYAVYSGLDENAEMELGENEMLNELDAGETRSNLASRGGTGSDFGSTRMDTLKSNKLPIALSAIGALVGAAGWIGQTDWFLTWLKGLKEFDFKYATDIIEKNIKMNPNGFSYTLQDNLPTDKALNLNFNQSVENLKEALKFYGNGSLEDGIKVTSEFIDPSQRAASVENLMSQLNDPSNKTIGDVFNTGEGTYGRAGTLFSQFGGAKGVIAKYVVKRLVGILVKQGAGAALGGALASAAPVLLPLGITMIAAGALVKLFRMKGQRQSRAATLNSLYQMMKNVKPTKDNDTILGLPPGPSSQKQIGGGSQGQLGQGEQEPEMDISGGKTKERGKPDFSKLDAQDTEFTDVTEPQDQRQLGAGAKRLGAGQGQEQTKTKKPYTQLNNTLTNFFKNLLDIRRQDQENLQEEFEAVKGLRTPQNKVMMNTFIVSVKKLRSLAKFINVLAKKDTKNQELNDLLQKLVQNKAHLTIIDIANLLEKYNTNSDMINKFIQIYMNNIKSRGNKFDNLQSIIDSQSQKMNEEAKGAKLKLNPETFLKEFNQNFKTYLKNLYQLFELISKLRSGEQKTTAEEQPLNEKKTKYSKKASEFIGKEITHLKKDKGYPQDRAVAAAINIAKEKGMKVRSKKK